MMCGVMAESRADSVSLAVPAWRLPSSADKVMLRHTHFVCAFPAGGRARTRASARYERLCAHLYEPVCLYTLSCPHTAIPAPSVPLCHYLIFPTRIPSKGLRAQRRVCAGRYSHGALRGCAVVTYLFIS